MKRFAAIFLVWLPIAASAAAGYALRRRRAPLPFAPALAAP